MGERKAEGHFRKPPPWRFSTRLPEEMRARSVLKSCCASFSPLCLSVGKCRGARARAGKARPGRERRMGGGQRRVSEETKSNV